MSLVNVSARFVNVSMPADITCGVVLSDGSKCGYQPQGATTKLKLTDLLRHRDSHLQHATKDDKGQAVVTH